jgi:6-pyruvoyltetrahydropterin/6-carboxytetrahydropterin synthase
MIVYKKFNIESARSLPHVNPSHPCSRVHGHSFEIIIKVKGDIDKKSGFVIDFEDIQNSFNPIGSLLDHSYLNDIEGLENPTSENLCIYIWDAIKTSLPNIFEIEIKETKLTGCVYRGGKE